MRRKQLILAGVFLALLVAPAIGQLAQIDADIRRLERREPEPLPALPRTMDEWRAFPKRLDRYLADSLGFRPYLIAGLNAIRYALGRSTSSEVLLGKDEWLFFTGDREHEQFIGTDRFTEASLERWFEAMEARQSWLAARGIPMVVFIAPNKHSIYPEMLPDWVRRRETATRTDQVVARAARSSLRIIDARPSVLAAKDRAQAFYKRDTHWTRQAAFAATMPLLQWISGQRPDYRSPDPLWFQPIASVRAGPDLDLARMIGLHWFSAEAEMKPIRLDGDALLDQQLLPRRDRLTALISTRNETGPTMLIYGDSFIGDMIPLLVQGLRRLVVADHKRMTFDPAFIEEEKPDLVVFEFVERFLSIELTNPPEIADR